MKRMVLYPFLFVLYSVLSPLAYNLGQIDPELAIRPLGVLLLSAALIICLLWAWLKNLSYAAYLSFLGLVFLLVFAYIHRLLRLWMVQPDSDTVFTALLLAWGVFVFGIGSLIWRRFGSRGWITPALNIIMALSLIFPVIQARGELFAAAQANVKEDLPLLEKVPALDCSERPDIYYIILDGYGRGDVLEQMYGLDNEPFLRFLEDKGFYVARQSVTNYTKTIFSIPAALNFAYIDPQPPGVSGWEYFSSLMADNRLLYALDACGYQTVALESGFSYTEEAQVDLYLEENRGLNEFESMLIAESPIDLLADELDLELPDFSHEAHSERVLFSFEQLRRMPEMAGPKFVFAHILTPHPPFVFDAQGNQMEPPGSYSIRDGDDYTGSWQEYREGYLAQVQHANQQLQSVIEALLENSERPPVIILQGDHGPGGRLDWHSLEESCVWERTGILNAYYLPGDKTGQLYSQISPVNSFRVVLNAYFGTDLPLLPDKTYFYSPNVAEQVIDVTERRASRLNCAWPDAGGY